MVLSTPEVSFLILLEFPFPSRPPGLEIIVNYNFVHSFMVPIGWILMTAVIPGLFLPLVPPLGRLLCLSEMSGIFKKPGSDVVISPSGSVSLASSVLEPLHLSSSPELYESQ